MDSPRAIAMDSHGSLSTWPAGWRTSCARRIGSWQNADKACALAIQPKQPPRVLGRHPRHLLPLEPPAPRHRPNHIDDIRRLTAPGAVRLRCLIRRIRLCQEALDSNIDETRPNLPRIRIAHRPGEPE